MKTSGVCAGILLLLISGEAMGREFGTDNEMMPGCRAMLAPDQRNILRQGECIGAVAAITHIDLAVAADLWRSHGARPIIDSQPARLQENFYDLAVEAPQGGVAGHLSLSSVALAVRR
jgi:hypothetical protein